MLKPYKNWMKNKTERIKQMKKSHVAVMAGFMATVVTFSGMALMSGRIHQRTEDKAGVKTVQEENLFALDLEDDVKIELKKGLASFGDTIYHGHADQMYFNFTRNFLPFGVEIYEVLSNKKPGASVEGNEMMMVMAGNDQAAGNTDASQNPVEAPAEQPEVQTPVEPETEASVEVPAEPETEAPVESEPETEAPTEEYVEEEPLFDQVYTVEDYSEPAYEDTSVTYTNSAISITSDEYYWLTQIVEAEAGDQDQIGKILVANVIFNRVYSGEYPFSVYDVIFQNNGRTYQFEPVKNGMIYSVTPSYDTICCVDRALNGEDYSQGALYFTMRTSPNSWFNRCLTLLFVHGDHYFYR